MFEFPDFCFISSNASYVLSLFLLANIIIAFYFAISIAASFPIPVFAPVIITTFPSRFLLTLHTPPLKYIFNRIKSMIPPAA